MIWRMVEHALWRIDQRERNRRSAGRRGFIPIMRTYINAEIELVCPNDACMAYDVDRPPDSTPRVLRHHWHGPAGSRCPHCGTTGKEAD